MKHGTVHPVVWIFCLLVLALAQPRPAAGQDTNGLPDTMPIRSDEPILKEKSGGWSKEMKLLALNGAVVGGFATYGLLFWGYGESSPQIVQEGWFGQNTMHGGADKAGHAYTAYIGALAFSELCERWGYEPAAAARNGALSSLTALTMMEVGDMFTAGGFCFEDLAVDAVGAAFGYLRRTHPMLQRRVDFRAEYIPSRGFIKEGGDDLLTDYAGYKYLIALKGDGFDGLSPSWLKYFELQAGYYTRGYEPSDRQYHDERSRNMYVAVGLNLSHLFEKQGWHKTANFLHFYQVPYTCIASEDDLNK